MGSHGQRGGWGREGFARQKFTIATVTSPRALSHGLCCVHRTLPRASEIRNSGLESAAALQNQLWLAEQWGNQHSTALFFYSSLHPSPQSSTWHVKQKLGEIVATAPFFFSFLKRSQMFLCTCLMEKQSPVLSAASVRKGVDSSATKRDE